MILLKFLTAPVPIYCNCMEKGDQHIIQIFSYSNYLTVTTDQDIFSSALFCSMKESQRVSKCWQNDNFEWTILVMSFFPKSVWNNFHVALLQISSIKCHCILTAFIEPTASLQGQDMPSSDEVSLKSYEPKCCFFPVSDGSVFAVMLIHFVLFHLLPALKSTVNAPLTIL